MTLVKLTSAQVESVPEEELVRDLAAKYKLETPVLEDDKAHISYREVNIDVSQDPMRMIWGSGVKLLSNSNDTTTWFGTEADLSILRARRLGTVRSSKKQVVLDVANKDGGAHVDPDVPLRHVATSEPPLIFGLNEHAVRPNLARSTVAQAGNELLEYLERNFPVVKGTQ